MYPLQDRSAIDVRRDTRSEMVIDMDSSTEEKWSRLVILKTVRSGLVGQALTFTDNKQVGLLVNAFARPDHRATWIGNISDSVRHGRKATAADATAAAAAAATCVCDQCAYLRVASHRIAVIALQSNLPPSSLQVLSMVDFTRRTKNS